MVDLFPIASFILNLLLLPLLAVLWDVRIKITKVEVITCSNVKRIEKIETRFEQHVESSITTMQTVANAAAAAAAAAAAKK